MTYATLLETYTLTDLLELNDLTEEDCLKFLVEEGFIKIPEIRPLTYDAETS